MTTRKRNYAPSWTLFLHALFWFTYLVFFILGQSHSVFIILPLFMSILFEEDNLPYISLLAISLLQDVSQGFILGMHALLYTLYTIFLASQRRFLFKRSFFVIWIVFSLTGASALLLKEIFSYLSGSIPQFSLSVFVEWGGLTCLFPLFFHLMSPLFYKMTRPHETV